MKQEHKHEYNFGYNKTVILMCGNIGSGKSTYVKKHLADHVLVSRDSIRYMLGNGQYVFLTGLESSVIQCIVTLYLNLLKTNIDIVIDETNINKRLRRHYIEEAKAHGYKIVCIVMPKLTKKESIKRRLASPHGNIKNAAAAWGKVWSRFNKGYEKPTIDEGFDCIIENPWDTAGS